MAEATSVERQSSAPVIKRRGATHIPMTATFLPGPIFARTIGLYVVMPAQSIVATTLDGMFSGIGKVKYSCTLT